MKRINTILAGVVLLLLNSSQVLASGMPYSPYNPYHNHVPVETGLVGTPIYILGAVLFIAGVLLLLNVSALRSKLNLD